jgi:hypothetical protein
MTELPKYGEIEERIEEVQDNIVKNFEKNLNKIDQEARS